MDDAARFLKAQLDKHEAAARAAAGDTSGRWYLDNTEGYVHYEGGEGAAYVAVGPWGGGLEGVHSAHIIQHDPDSVLRRIAAHRQILTAYIKVEADGIRGDGWIALRFAVETLAEGYGHEGEPTETFVI